MVGINEEKAIERLEEIAGKHGLNPDILRDVIEGRSKGLSQKEIANQYGYNKNTISKYNRKLEEELSEEDLGDLLMVIGALIGGAYLLGRILDQ